MGSPKTGLSYGYLPRFNRLACTKIEPETGFVLADERLSRSTAGVLLATQRVACVVI